MDNTKNTPKVLSLCSGYGGIEIGLERALGEITVLAHVEIEAFAIANLVNKMETGQMVTTPVWTDLKTFRSEIFRGHVDILTGGYPCQPFSAAGKRKGEKDPRHLWPYIRKTINGCRPSWVFFENVEGHLSLGISKVLSDLERMGYTVKTGIFSATEAGAPHQRKRVFILGHAKMHDGRSLPQRRRTRRSNKPSTRDELANNLCVWKLQPDGSVKNLGRWPEHRSKKELADSPGEGLQRHTGHEQKKGWQETGPDRPAAEGSLSFWPARPGENQHDWEAPRVVGDSRCVGQEVSEEQTARAQQPGTPGKQICEAQSGLGRTINGPPHRVDRLRLLGNGVVPQVAEKAFITLYNQHMNLRRLL